MLRIVWFLFAWLLPAVAFAQTPLETYIYGQPAATAPYASGLRIPAAPSSSASALQYIPSNALATLTDTQTLTNKTLTAPAITGATISTSTLASPTINGGTLGAATAWTVTSGSPVVYLGFDSSNHAVTGTPTGAGNVSVSGSPTTSALPFWLGTGNNLSSTGVPFSTTGANTVIETLGTGLLASSILPQATSSTQGVVTCGTGTICSGGVITVTGGGGGALTVTGGGGTQSSVTTLNFPGCVVVSGGSGTANAALTANDRSYPATGSAAFATTDMCGQVNVTSGSAWIVPAIGGGVWNTGATARLINNTGGIIVVTNSATVNGPCGGGTFAMLSGTFCDYTSNGTSLDSSGFTGYMQTVYGATRVAAGTTDTLLSSDCGRQVLYTGGAAVTVTIPASIVPVSGIDCAIIIRTSSANKVSVNGSAVTAATLVDGNGLGYTGTRATTGASISLDLTTVLSVTTAYLDGSGS